METALLKENESLDDLILGGLRIIQPRAGYRFSIDAVLLAHFLPGGQKGTIIDLGSGNGAISLLLSALHPQAQIIGVEIQEQMVERARRSAQLNRLTERVSFINADIRTLHHHMDAAVADWVLCNPPFWKENEGKINPHPEAAAARHELKLTLKELIPQAARILKDRGSLALVHRAERLPEIIALLPEHRLQPRRLRPVYPQPDRSAALILLEAQKASRVPLEIKPPLLLRQKGGDWSDEIKSWYPD
ncbi:MAG: tRNA1(Val) (adenine(37)-N6)-methyltransferase [Syntrophomonadaceae bacterium]|nr:tRNA1(Val) (adenine(37)-N6)-methyltransferase [Syntrophomonadaceae bacterium]